MKKFSLGFVSLVLCVSVFFLYSCENQEDNLNRIESLVGEKTMLVDVVPSFGFNNTNKTWQHVIDISSGDVQQIEFTVLDHQGNETEIVGGKTFEKTQKIIISQIKKELFYEMTNNNYLTEESARKDGITDPKQLQILAEQKKDFDKRVSQYADLKFTKITFSVNENDYKKLSIIDNVNITKREIKKRIF
jgi:hypothetical protein